MLNNRKKYNEKLQTLLDNPPIDKTLVLSDEIEAEAHWAKYICVLISGYLEQSFKDIILDYVSRNAENDISKYIEDCWPDSTNMKTQKMVEIISNFNTTWADYIEVWIDKENLKSQINNLISWRNSISHGEESNTTGVTLKSVKMKYNATNKLLDKIEELFSIT